MFAPNDIISKDQVQYEILKNLIIIINLPINANLKN